MSCTITYPTSGGPGACNSSTNELITACGTWNRPDGSTTGTVRVYGRLYDPGETPPSKPPHGDANLKTASSVTDIGGDRQWHFNSDPLPGGQVGVSKKLMVWITADDAACYVPASNPTTFNCCASGASGCTPAPCGTSYGTPPAAICADLTVIRHIAPRTFRLGLDDSVFSLARATRTGESFEFPPVFLDYSLDHSTSERAVWLGRGLLANAALSLAVVRTSCGGLCAELSLQRLTAAGVLPPLIWESISFDLLQGGTLISAQAGAESASVLVVGPAGDDSDAAQAQPEAVPELPRQAGRGRNRGAGRQ